MSKYIGKKSERVEIDVVVMSYRMIPGFMGDSHLYRMEDYDRNKIVWFSSREIEGFLPGNVYEIRGTVKEHKKHRGENQTTLTRVKVLRKLA